MTEAAVIAPAPGLGQPPPVLVALRLADSPSFELVDLTRQRLDLIGDFAKRAAFGRQTSSSSRTISINAATLAVPRAAITPNSELRSLLVCGATSVSRRVKGNDKAPRWLVALLARRPFKAVAVALQQDGEDYLGAAHQGRDISK
ncbi:hypothetical protein [Mesorhizobium sp. WSM3864]|uniref:hypothetical protein n=1 Tax=Mesorhizobium sp. WSM3864 TaxID=2029404 RepID=UPI001FE0E175|nr:hypothetical protein [Mesorhizobium sp. WSM3864]